MPGPHDGWTSEVSSSLALAGFLGLVFAGFTLLAMEPLMAVDAYFNLAPPPAGWVPVLHLLDRVGQRAICLPLLAVVVWACCRRQESWRPAVVAAGSVFSLNLVVGILKLVLGRGQPAPADPSFFIGGHGLSVGAHRQHRAGLRARGLPARPLLRREPPRSAPCCGPRSRRSR